MIWSIYLDVVERILVFWIWMRFPSVMHAVLCQG
jgi:hypothetical protein